MYRLESDEPDVRMPNLSHSESMALGFAWIDSLPAELGSVC